MKNFHILIWTVRGSGGCQKSRQVNGVQVSCQHNCPVDQSICLHADMSVHRLVYLSTNINNKKHHLPFTIFIYKKNSTLRHDVYPTVFQHRNRFWMPPWMWIKIIKNKPSQKKWLTKSPFPPMWRNNRTF